MPSPLLDSKSKCRLEVVFSACLKDNELHSGSLRRGLHIFFLDATNETVWIQKQGDSGGPGRYVAQQLQTLRYQLGGVNAHTGGVAARTVKAGDDPELKPFVEQGRALFMQREGQLNLACANCHDDNWDKHLAGSPVTQAQPTGYPEYRLDWQTLGSLERRLRSCMSGVRAQAYDYGAPELVALELYLMSRARGMKMETPAVRP